MHVNEALLLSESLGSSRVILLACGHGWSWVGMGGSKAWMIILIMFPIFWYFHIMGPCWPGRDCPSQSWWIPKGSRTPLGAECCAVLSHSVVPHSFVIPWTVACQAPLSMGFSRQEYWSGLPFPPLGDLPQPGVKSMSFVSPALAVWSESCLLSRACSLSWNWKVLSAVGRWRVPSHVPGERLVWGPWVISHSPLMLGEN